jgi:galactoside O-acetyltransferase
MGQERNFNHIGDNVVIHDPVAIINPEAITLNNNIIISEFVFIAAGEGLYLGNFIHLAAHSCISGGGVCVLEDFVGVCAGVKIITGSDDVSGKGIPTPTIPKELQKQYRSVYRSYVHCQKHSFLATNVVVQPGVTIGEGAVVSSGSVVTKDVEPWSVYMGIPARKVKKRPKEKILEMEKTLYRACGVEPADFSDVVKKIHKK